jgi:two-component system phosphate regulon response regulator OmpR
MSSAPHIVVVDDERDVREMIEEYLSGHGFRVSTAEGGNRLRAILAGEPVDLVILDINMPEENGLSLARHIRENYGSGIIMLTAAGDLVDRIIGLEIGADDYIAKPFDPRELLARVRSVLRRVQTAPSPQVPAASAVTNRVRFGRCVLDLDAQTLTTLSGEDVPITTMEFDLLKAFASRPNRVLTRDQLLDLAHHRGWEPFDRSIDIRIARIRRKIEADPAKPQTIKTVRGSGYVFVPDPDG